MSEVGDIRWGRLGSLCLIALCFVTYWPVFTNQYGYNDDYPHYDAIINGHTTDWRQLIVGQGRPVSGAINWVIFRELESLNQLSYPRFLSVCFLALFSILLFRMVRQHGVSVMASFMIACLVVTSPPFAVYASWAILVSSSLAASLSLLGGRCLQLALQKKSLYWRLFYLFGGGALIFLSLCTYQSVAFLALIPMVLKAFKRNRDNELMLPDFFSAVGILLIVVFVYRGCHLAALYLQEATSPQSARANFIVNPLEKVVYFVRIIGVGLMGWGRFGELIIKVVVTSFFGLSLIAGMFAVSGKRFWAWLAVVVVTLTISLLPVLVTAESDLQYRTQSALQALLILLAGIGLEAFMKSCVPNRCMLFRVIAILLIAASVAAARSQVYRFIVAPNVRELAAFRREAEKLKRPTDKYVFFSPQPAWLDREVRSEFGVIASPAWWNTRSMIRLVIDERFPESAALLSSPPWHLPVFVADTAETREGVFDIYSTFHEGEYESATHPYFGKILRLPSGWCHSAWFGTFFSGKRNFFWHNSLGPMILEQNAAGDYYFNHPVYGVFYTGESFFPHILLEDGESMLLDLKFVPL